jgi:cobalamin biosynthesis Mg chelatase CobN
MEHSQHLRESSIDVTYLDFDATLATESVEVISPVQRSRGSSSSQGQARLTATQRQLQELPEVLAGHAVAEGPSIAIRDKWRCQDTTCGNHPYVCWVQRVAGQPDRFENHFPASSNIVAMWARNVILGRASVDEPDDVVRVALRTSRELAAKEKAKEKQQSSTPAFNADSFMSAIAASALSVGQLAQSQLLTQQAPIPAPAPAPAAPSASSASTPSVEVSGWRDLEYANVMELSLQSRWFFRWWINQTLAHEVPDIERCVTRW